ncbi:hypothetical protein YPPY95_1538, partial [Yersinia pestis PY-95]
MPNYRILRFGGG